MRLRVLIWIAALCPAAAAPADIFSPRDGIAVPHFAEETIVCVGENASTPARAAAELIAEKLRAAGGPENNLLTAEALNDDPVAAGTHHVVAVGTWLDNVVTRKCWGHWAMTRWQREMLERDQKASREGRPASMLSARTEKPDFRWQGDFSAFGFGHFFGSVGYVEPGRNPYCLALIPNGLAKAEDLGKADQFFVIKVTGTDAAGVARAARAFTDSGMLHGIVPLEGAELQGDWSPAALGAPQLAAPLPTWAPAADLPGDKPLRFLGWLQAHSLIYAGLAEASGIEPRLAWRLKYQLPRGFKDYMTFVTPRASDNEVLIAEMADPAAAREAVEGLKASVGKDWGPFTAAGGWQGYRSAEGHTFLHSGQFVLAESLPPGFDESLLRTLRKP